MVEIDETQVLREAWGRPDPPSPDAHTRARAALMEQLADPVHRAGRPVPRRRLRWGLVATAVTAAAAVLALVLAQPVLGPDSPAPSGGAGGQVAGTGDQTPGGTTPGDALSPGQQLLLAAATTAAEQPAEEGEYWYLEEEFDDVAAEEEGIPNPQTLHTWTAPDGRSWGGNVELDEVYLYQDHPGFQLARSLLTEEQLHGLPTDPAQLIAWLTASLAEPTGWPEDHPWVIEGDDSPDQGEVAFELTHLLYGYPVPPALRAAAYAALATMPEVESLGPVDGGEQLRIAIEPMSEDKFPDGEVPDGLDHILLVVDPATSALASWTNYQGTTRILTAGWTDQPPPVAEPEPHPGPTDEPPTVAEQ